jgi:hypothetical protein
MIIRIDEVLCDSTEVLDRTERVLKRTGQILDNPWRILISLFRILDRAIGSRIGPSRSLIEVMRILYGTRSILNKT